MFNIANPFTMVVAIVAIVMLGRVWRAHIIARGRTGRSEADEHLIGSMQQQVDKLTDRVAVLERLLTDDDRRLSREIDRLRDRPSL
jgi:hypothetical protein